MGLFDFLKKNEKTRQYSDGNTTDPREALEFLLHEGLRGCFAVKDVLEDGCICLPDWQLTITPAVTQLTEKSAVLDFQLQTPSWGQTVHESCASVGSDPKQAIGMAAGSFLFSCMQGITRLLQKDSPLSLETEFAGKPHRFKVYISDIVGMGASPQAGDVRTYWELLRDDIVKRLGNQRLCYVKLYASKVNDKIVCECRINDIKSEELSEKLTGVVEKWDVQGFASHKQFFFLEQDADTVQPYPYWGEQGEKELAGKVLHAVRLFHACDTQEAFDTLQDLLAAELGDATLAAECRLFLPEICAEHAFGEQMQFSEAIELLPANGQKLTLYKHQLMDYHRLSDFLFSILQQGAFGDETNDVYRELIGCSAIFNVIQQMREKGAELTNCRLTSLLFQVDEAFEIR